MTKPAKPKKKKTLLGEFQRYAMIGAAAHLGAQPVLATATHVFPDLATSTLDGHMQKQGMAGMSENFTSQNIRVYDHRSYLSISHRAGYETAALWKEPIDGPVDAAVRVVATPITFLFSTLSGTENFAFGNPVGAYSMSAAGAPSADRTCYIHPPARADAGVYINNMTGFDAGNYTFDSDKSTLSDALYRYIIAHEARHCDQNRTLTGRTALNEGDADIYALNLVQASVQDATAVRDAQDIVRNLRIVAASVGVDIEHGTAPAMARGANQSVLQSARDAGAYRSLTPILAEITTHHEEALDALNIDMSHNERYYHAAHAALRVEAISSDRPLRTALEDFIVAMDYFEAHAQGQIIKTPTDQVKIDAAFIAQRYEPVESRLPQAQPRNISR